MDLEVPRDLRRGRHGSEEDWLESARVLLALLASAFGHDDLGDVALLDVGCGTKLTKAVLEDGLPIGRYVGVDVSADIIDFLTASIDDPRFEFHHLDAHNDRYNPGGRPLQAFERLPVGDEGFDVISLFSVFTHLNPTDFRTMLELLREHVRPDGGLLFSLFVDQGVDPVVQAELERRIAAGDLATIRAVEARLAASGGDGPAIPDFVDRVPDQPLLEAVYSERYARELLAGTGWEPVELRQPVPGVIQHHFVCRPT